MEPVRTRMILHIFGWDEKFFLPFRDLIRNNFQIAEHHFVVHGDIGEKLQLACANTSVFPCLIKSIATISIMMRRADKIILHGLFSSHLLYLLTTQPWLLKKCYWVMWGGDLYVHQAEKRDWRWEKNEILRRFVIRRLGNFITHVKGDYELAQRWYGARGRWHECFMYPSNVFKDHPVKPKEGATINILVGNSADPSNNHIEVLDKLRAFRDEDICIYSPLSYGDRGYAMEIYAYGKEVFGDKFVPMLDFKSREEYISLLEKIDIAAFNHQRQQGMGNIITLLGLGKTVYMRNDITSWEMFFDFGIIVRDIEMFSLVRNDEKTQSGNRHFVASFFSKEKLVDQWRRILG